MDDNKNLENIPSEADEQNVEENQDDTVAVSKGKLATFLENLFGGSDKNDSDNLTDSSSVQNKKEPVTDNFDKRLADEKAKWEAEREEAARIDKLPEAQKVQAEIQRQKKELEETKIQLLQRELKSEAVNYLSKEGYPVELADILNLSSKEKKEESIEMVTRVFENSLATAMRERLKGKTPAGLGNKNPVSAASLTDALTQHYNK